MSGFGGQVLSHVVRRSVEQYPGMLEGDFNMGPPIENKIELSNTTMVLLILIAVTTGLIIASVDYTVGSVIAALTMIESPSTTTIIESAPPAYSDEPDAPLEKKEEAAETIEVIVVEHKPVTARVFATIKHLHSVGGFFARWRGFLPNVLYHIAVNVIGHLIGGLYSRFLGHVVGQACGYWVAILFTARLRMVWTHSMIAMPSSAPWYKRFVPRKQCGPLIFSAMIYALARQAVLIVPFVVAHVMGLFTLVQPDNKDYMQHLTGLQAALVMVRVLAVPVSALLMALFVYLPADATLTRVEACLLPADQKTIVPFDREAIVGDIDLTEKGSGKKLFKAAWKSVNRSVRIRLVKLYVKLAAYQFAVFLVGLHLVIGVLYITSRDQMVNTIKMVVV